jgi:hypothetical protein
LHVALANNEFGARVPDGWHAEPVSLRWPASAARIMRLVQDDVVDPDNAHHHDPARLAASLMRLVASERPGRSTNA